MTTGLFPIRRTEAGVRPRRLRSRGPALIDRFAEELSKDGNVRRAAEAVGASNSYGKAMLQRIRRELGWQAR